MRALIIDDSSDVLELLAAKLEKEGIDVVSALTLDSAKAAMQASRFDVAFVDDLLIVDGRATRRALITVSTVRERMPRALVVGYTQSPEGPGYFEKILSHGAHHARWLEDVLKETSWRDIVEEHVRGLSDGIVLGKLRDLRTRAAVHEIGPETLRLLLMECLGPGEADLTSLSGGISGDLVFKVRFRRRDDGIQESRVVKLSRWGGGLQREFSQAPSRAVAWYSVSLDRVTSEAIAGWHCASGPFAAHHKTLEHVIARIRSSTAAERLAAQLWRKCLSQVVSAEPPKDAQLPCLSPAFVHQVLEVCDLFIESKPKLSPRIVSQLRALRRRVEQSEGATWPFVPNVDVLCFSHGDFHPRNVLRQGSAFSVIDWARAAPAPRLVDVAALIVDLCVLRHTAEWSKDLGLNAAVADATVLSRLCAGSPPKKHWQQRGALAFCFALARHAIASGCRPEELSRAVVFQLLRYSRFATLPFSRRGMCLLSAASLVGDL